MRGTILMDVRKAFDVGVSLFALMFALVAVQGLGCHVLAEASRSLAMATPEPVSPLQHNNRAGELDVHGRWLEAIQEYTIALKGEPDNGAFKNNFSTCLVHYGDALVARQDLHGALEQYRKSLELNPDNLSARSGLGEVQHLISASGKGAQL